MPTIAEMKQAKYYLENTILNEITAFEDAFGVTVAFISSTHSQQMCGKPQTVNVTAEVKI